MGQFEDYLEQKKQLEEQNQNEMQDIMENDQAYIDDTKTMDQISLAQEQKGIGSTGESDNAAGYAELLMEQRLTQTTFEERTEYYFKNTDYMQAKAKRYKALSTGIGGELKAFSKKHTYHNARKRKKSAKAASKHFKRAVELEKEHANNTAFLTPLQEFKARNEIMRARMEGMTNAVKMKSVSSKDEGFRIAKLKYCCLNVLLDQVKHLREEKSEEFDKIQKSLEKEIKIAKRDMKDYAPDPNKVWADRLGLNEKGYMSKKLVEAKKINPSINEEDLKLQLQLSSISDSALGDQTPEELQEKANKNKAFGVNITGRVDEIKAGCYFIKRDIHGKPINKEELLKEKRNKKWIETCLDPAQKTEAYKMIFDLYKKIEKYPLPTPQELKKKGAMYFYNKNPHAFMEFSRLTLLVNNIGETPTFSGVLDYFRTNMEFRKKSDMMKFMSSMFEFEIDEKHLIKQKSGYKFNNLARAKKLDVKDDEEKAEYEDNINSMMEEYEKAYNTYQDEVTATKKNVEVAKNKFTVNYDKLKAQADKMDNKVFNENSLEKFTVVRNANQSVHNPHYLRAFDQVHKKLGSDCDMSRICGSLLRDVKFDKNWEPVSDKDFEAHMWNMKLLRHMQTYFTPETMDHPEESLKAINEMIDEEFAKTFTEATFELPNPELLEKEISEPAMAGSAELNSEYAENTLWKNIETYTVLKQKALSYSNLKAKFPHAEEVMKEHPEFDTYNDAFSILAVLLDQFINMKYGFSADVGDTTVKASKPAPLALVGLVEGYKESYNAYKEALAKAKK